MIIYTVKGKSALGGRMSSLNEGRCTRKVSARPEVFAAEVFAPDALH